MRLNEKAANPDGKKGRRPDNLQSKWKYQRPGIAELTYIWSGLSPAGILVNHGPFSIRESNCGWRSITVNGLKRDRTRLCQRSSIDRL